MALDTVIEFVTRYGYAVILVGAIIDGTGVPFPGRLMLIVAGGLAHRAQLEVPVVIALAALGALLGDHVWYLAGRLDRHGRVLEAYCRIVPSGGRCVERAQGYLRRFGPMAFVIGRLFAAIRMLTVPVAAAAGIGYGRFLLYDAAGALLWATIFVLLGHAVGARAPELGAHVGIVIGTGVALAVGTAAIVLWRRQRARS